MLAIEVFAIRTGSCPAFAIFTESDCAYEVLAQRVVIIQVGASAKVGMTDHLGAIGKELRHKAKPESGVDAHPLEDQGRRAEGKVC